MEKIGEESASSERRSCFGRKKVKEEGGRKEVRIGQWKIAWGQLDRRLGGDEVRAFRSIL